MLCKCRLLPSSGFCRFTMQSYQPLTKQVQSVANEKDPSSHERAIERRQKKNRLPATEIKESSFFLHFVLLWDERHSSACMEVSLESTMNPEGGELCHTHERALLHRFARIYPRTTHSCLQNYSSLFILSSIQCRVSWHECDVDFKLFSSSHPRNPSLPGVHRIVRGGRKMRATLYTKKIVNKHKKDT